MKAYCIPVYKPSSNLVSFQSITRDLEAHESSTDGYEEIGQHAHAKKEPAQQTQKTRPSALQLVEPKNGPSRTLWSEIPEVIHSGILRKHLNLTLWQFQLLNIYVLQLR